jgi:hypothetical protein
MLDGPAFKHPGLIMTMRLASCSCGQLTAVATGDPVRISICHCLACQRRTGGPFAEQARFAHANVTVAGQSATYIRAGDEGTHVCFHFCPVCGATVYYVPAEATTWIAIPVGAFADPAFPPPTVSVYEERMHSWVMPPAGAEHFL